MIIRNADKNKIQEELRFQEYQNRLNLDYYRSIEADSKEIYKIKHDFMNVLQVMQTLFAKDDIQGNKYAEELLLELKKNIQNTYTAEYSQTL